MQVADRNHPIDQNCKGKKWICSQQKGQVRQITTHLLGTLESCTSKVVLGDSFDGLPT